MSNYTLSSFLNEYYLKAERYNKEKEGVKLLLLEFMGYSNSDYLLNKDEILDEAKVNLLKEKIDDYLERNIPPQYILGYTYFYSMKLFVSKNVLIPRFDTEVLVDTVINNINGNESIIDIGCGSGAISLAIKKNMPNTKVSGVDISPDAILLSNKNKEALNLDVDYFENDLLEGLGRYDVIVSNPPYISFGDKISDLVYQNEPHLALFAPENGLYFYRRILASASSHLNIDGKIFFEIGYNQKEDIEKLVKELMPNKNVKFFKDYGDRYRVAYIY